MRKAIEAALSAAGDESSIVQWKPVSGGSINKAFYLRTDRREYFAKMNPNATEDFFNAEKDGLHLLHQNGIRVPEPLLILPREHTEMVFLMEWIPSNPSTGKADRALGSLVANMHRKKETRAGLKQSNFIGEFHQPNEQSTDWVTFFRDQRLGEMQRVANEKGLLSKMRNHRLTELGEHLHSILNHEPDFSLLHGDLWGGNWLESEGGHPFLIDPAVYYGDREVDLAFTYLFGGYSKAFYEQYHADYPLEKEWEDRIPIYQLYYLLVHLNLFGESYGGAVDRILKKYTT
ncbi:MAG: fructosamine kinase family protein [Anaerobacillus sp.]